VAAAQGICDRRLLITLAELRVRFKPKRNFIKLLDGVVRSAAK
jgi:hypothetical protein